jgi:hypothetical protein
MFAMFVEAVSITDDPKYNEEKGKALVLAFDVDAPCIIATPYNGDWESLSRPLFRSSSVCWVVELASVNGYNSKVPETIGERLEITNNPPSLRVLRKLRGLWEIMKPLVSTAYFV